MELPTGEEGGGLVDPCRIQHIEASQENSQESVRRRRVVEEEEEEDKGHKGERPETAKVKRKT